MCPNEMRSAPEHQPPESGTEKHELQRLRRAVEQLSVENEHLRDSLAVLETARDEYYELYDIAPLPLLTLDLSGVIRYANLAAIALLNQERNRILGCALRSFLTADDRPKLSQHLLTLRTMASASCELHLLLARDKEVPVRLLSRVSARNSAVLLHTALLDQREEERLAEEKRHLLDEAQVARQASASKDQFIAMLSHELRTPLTPILAAASAYKEDLSLSPQLRGVFERIANHAAAEARLVDDLLDANGIVRGKMGVQRQPTDVLALLRDCIEQARPDALAKQQNLEVTLETQDYYVLGDAVRLRQVFSNLLRNAIKYTPNEGRIQVRSWNRPGRLVVDVEDNGIGFEPAAIPRLFDPFDQLNDGQASRGGLGLGLAISRGLVELHEGRIEAASRGPGCGARFAVELPTTNEVPQAPESVRPGPFSQRGEQGSEVRVLLVEDHADTAELFADLLGLQGYKVVLASSIAAALAVPSDGFDLIISDLGLPDGTGSELITKLQAVRRRPAIALSGFGRVEDIEAAKRAGFDVHLTKPIDMARLFSAIQRLLEARIQRA